MILLDTHVWLWWVNQDTTLLRAEWIRNIEQADAVAVASISLFEVAWLAHHERIELSMPIDEWFTNALKLSGISLVPISTSIATIATELPYHHRDPQDRLIMATAIDYQAQLASADTKFAQYNEVRPLLV